jgi:signal transduction histidine kinase
MMTSFLVVFLHFIFVVVRTYVVEDELNRNYVSRQVDLLLAAIDSTGAVPVLRASAVPSEYFGKYQDSYAFRISFEDGRTIAEHDGAKLAALSPYQRALASPPDFWLLDLDKERRFYVAGGLRHKLDSRYLTIEVAAFGDPEHLYIGNIFAEVVDDVLLPMLPLALLTLGVATLSVRRSLRPLARAAQQAQSIAFLDGTSRIDVRHMPHEAASLAVAINELLDRARESVRSQQFFIARAAHELRTPLAAMMLELGQIDSGRGRRLEEDVRLMSNSVERLLTLARLQGGERPHATDLDLGETAVDVVNRYQEWAAQAQHKMDVVVCDGARASADDALTREVLRNLIENAVRHTPAGTCVRVTAGPGSVLVVEDGGVGIASEEVESLLLPFKKGNAASDGAGLGLAIVRQAVNLQGGILQIGSSVLGGAKISVTLPTASLPKYAPQSKSDDAMHAAAE